jgi:hypothetical protein
MNFSLSSQLLLDDDIDDADDFNLDFDEDYEYLSDEEFEVIIEYDEYNANDLDIPGGDFCLDDDLDGFDNFDASEDALTEKDYADEE